MEKNNPDIFMKRYVFIPFAVVAYRMPFTDGMDMRHVLYIFGIRVALWIP